MCRSTSLHPIRPNPHGFSLAHFGPGCVRQPLQQEACSCRSDVASSIPIGVCAVATGNTSESGLIWTIGARGVSALRARLAGLARVNEYDRDAKPSGLVLYLIYKVAKGPTGYHAVEPLGAVNAVADTIQSLQDNHRARVLCGKAHNLVADFVIQVSHPTRFLALLVLYQISTAMPLVAPPQVSKMLSPVTGFPAVKEHRAVWGYDSCVSHHAQVNTNECGFTGTSGRCLGDANGQHDIPLTASLEQLGVASGKGHVLPITRGNA